MYPYLDGENIPGVGLTPFPYFLTVSGGVLMPNSKVFRPHATPFPVATSVPVVQSVLCPVFPTVLLIYEFRLG